jgi:hypothetical protein
MSKAAETVKAKILQKIYYTAAQSRNMHVYAMLIVE